MRKASLAVSIVYFSVLAIFTTAIYAQQSSRPYPAEVVNAVQDQRLQDIEKRADQLEAKLDAVTESNVNLANSVNRFTGIGMGMIATLTILQALQVILQVKKIVATKEGNPA